MKKVLNMTATIESMEVGEVFKVPFSLMTEASLRAILSKLKKTKSQGYTTTTKKSEGCTVVTRYR